MQTLREKIDKNADGVLSCEEINSFLIFYFGKEWFSLEVETIYSFLEDKYKKEFFDYDYTVAKINAIKTIYNSHSFFKDHVCFEKVVQAVCENRVHWDEDQEPFLEEINFAFDDLRGVFEINEELFSLEVMSYITGIAFGEGFFVLPENLKFVQKMLDILCKDKINDLELMKEEVLRKMKTTGVETLNEENIVDAQVLKLKRVLLYSPVKKRKKKNV